MAQNNTQNSYDQAPDQNAKPSPYVQTLGAIACAGSEQSGSERSGTRGPEFDGSGSRHNESWPDGGPNDRKIQRTRIPIMQILIIRERLLPTFRLLRNKMAWRELA